MKVLTKTKCHVMHFLLHMIIKRCKATTAFENTLKKEKGVSKQKHEFCCLLVFQSPWVCCVLFDMCGYPWYMGMFVGFVMILYSPDGILCNFLSFNSTGYIFQSNKIIQVGI